MTDSQPFATLKGFAKVGPSDVSFREQVIVGRNFAAEKVTRFKSSGSRFENCRFDKLSLGWSRGFASFGSGTATSEYIDCVFDGARLAMPVGGLARFVRCSFEDVRIKSWFGLEVELVECTFSGLMKGAFFNGTVPAENRALAGRVSNDFYGNDFRRMDLIDVAFRTGIDLTRQQLPVGPNYLYIENARDILRAARADVISWSDLKLRAQVLRLLAIDEDALAVGQEQIFLDVRDIGKLSQAPFRALVECYRRAIGNV